MQQNVTPNLLYQRPQTNEQKGCLALAKPFSHGQGQTACHSDQTLKARAELLARFEAGQVLRGSFPRQQAGENPAFCYLPIHP